MPVVVFLLDAMRYDYISEETTPFLHKCSQNGRYYKHVIPSVGFCERTEILTGQTPNESGFFTAIGYDPENSPFKSVKSLRFFELIEQCIPGTVTFRKLKRYYRVFIAILFRKFFGIKMNSYCIPFSLLRYFNLTEDGIDGSGNSSLLAPSILELLKKKNLSYFIDSVPRSRILARIRLVIPKTRTWAKSHCPAQADRFLLNKKTISA